MFNASFQWSDLLFMLQGTLNTLALTFWAVGAGTLLGLALGWLRTTVPKSINAVIGALLDVPRSVPLLIQIILVNSFKSMLGFEWSPFTVGCVVLALYTAAYCTEVVRSGINAVPFSTRRAARSLGMTYWQDLRLVVFPIALRVSLPSWIGVVLGVLKDTSIVLWIGMIELLRASQIIVTQTQEPILVLCVAGLIYFVVCFPIARLGGRLEARWNKQ
ncbi:amino acid ABC transporter permease [Ralstonia syzygii]|uniref:Putative amino acid ABC transporter transmembrane protein n=1 Tax=Ralstonia syzygii R24 TaxID=907261 RepID=G2ZZC7_9RALS|nr:amino acid ABC transporter permease [Ralstonia syzygii]CCA84229.1 putative amino acid ABC transporter transmembrane protein [Ralstonia syzygii R24]